MLDTRGQVRLKRKDRVSRLQSFKAFSSHIGKEAAPKDRDNVLAVAGERASAGRGEAAGDEDDFWGPDVVLMDE